MAKIKAICEKNKNQDCLDLIDDMSQIIADGQEKNNRNALVGDDLATFHQTMRTKLLALHAVIVKMLTPEEVKKINESGICPACKTAPAERPAKLTTASAGFVDYCVECYNSYAQSASICYLYELLDEPWLYAACIILAEAVLWACTSDFC